MKTFDLRKTKEILEKHFNGKGYDELTEEEANAFDRYYSNILKEADEK